MTAIGWHDNQESWWTEAKASMREALQSRAVLATAIVCGTFIALALLLVLGWLIYAQRDATLILSLVSILLNALVYSRLRRVEQQTNGHTTRLMDAALKDRE